MKVSKTYWVDQKMLRLIPNSVYIGLGLFVLFSAFTYGVYSFTKGVVESSNTVDNQQRVIEQQDKQIDTRRQIDEAVRDTPTDVDDGLQYLRDR